MNQPNQEYEREGQALAIINSGAVAAMTRGEIDSQIATAKQYPRSLAKVKDEARSLACMDPAKKTCRKSRS